MQEYDEWLYERGYIQDNPFARAEYEQYLAEQGMISYSLPWETNHHNE